VSPSVQGKQILGGGNPGGGNTLNGPRVKPAASSTLPFTGANLLPWLGIGICLIGLGIVATARNRALSDPRR
jgi:hypothetical protein